MRADGVAGLILAGGRSRRFADGPKEIAMLGGRTLIDLVIERARPQVGPFAISRGDAQSKDFNGIETVTDIYADCGPLGGLHAGLVWALSQSPPVKFLATFACDTPLIAPDLVAHLHSKVLGTRAPAAIAAADGERHPTLGLWSVSLEPAARQRLDERAYSLVGFAEAVGARIVNFEDPGGTAFFNINTREDLRAIERLLARDGDA